MSELASLFNPSSVALVGATDRSTWSKMAFDNLRLLGFQGRVHLVSRSGGLAHGQQTFTSVTEIAGTDDEEGNRKRIDAFYAKRGFTPDKVARDIVKAVLANKAVVPVTPEAKFGYRSYRFFPWASRIAARQKLTK